MRHRVACWLNTFAKLGFRRVRRRPAVRTHRGRRLARVEQLEPRQMLTGNYHVTTHLDVVDPNDGVVSLREAVTAAANETDDITFSPAVVEAGRIDLDSQITVTASINIIGPGADALAINAQGRGRVFLLNHSGANARISGLTITGGNAIGGGGGIYTRGHLTLDGVKVVGNKTDTSGGGVVTDFGAWLHIKNSTFEDNEATGASGEGTGGAVGLFYSVSDSLNIENTTFVGNKAKNGGAIRVSSYANNSTVVSIRNCTFSDNEALYGGAIMLHTFGTAPIEFINTTITDNEATVLQGGGLNIYNPAGAPIYFHNTIVAGNTAPAAYQANRDIIGAISGTGSHNLIGLGYAGLAIANGVAGNKIGVGTPLDAKLGVLADNGGPTLTHRPLPGSPAIDAGKDTLAAARDQRGFGRSVNTPIVDGAGGSSDMGAVEFGITTLLDAEGLLTVDDTDSHINSIVLAVGLVADRAVVTVNGKATPYGVGDVTAIVVIGGDGNDTINLSEINVANLPNLINVSIDGGLGDDAITGTSGDDRMSGGDGANLLVGGLGDDTYALNDEYFSTLGRRDEINDLGGVDTLDFSGWAGVSGVIVDLAKAAAAVQNLDGAAGKVRLVFTQANQIENVIGSSAADTIHGNSLANELFGMNGADLLHGYAGVDRLHGGDGDDQLYGGAGLSDQYDGGAGIDAANDPDISDIDTDGLSNSDEVLAGTDATDSDTDGDGLTDGFESQNDDPGTPDGELDPTDDDSDGDDLSDGEEDPDGDGATNDDEQGGGTDPNDPTSTPQGDSSQWRTFGDATIANGILTVGVVGASEHDIQEARFHGASIALRPEDYYSFMFDLNLFTWDSYKATGGSGTGYWDSFSISVTSLPYDTLQLDDDPLAYPFIWGGTNYLDRNLETRTEDELTLTFSGDGENTMYLNLVLDTSNPPQTDGEFPSWGTFSLPAFADLDISHVASGPVAETDEEKVGGLVAVLENDADHLLKQSAGDWYQPHTRFTVKPEVGVKAGDYFTLVFPTSLVVRELLSDGSERQIISGQTQISAAADSIFEAYGTEKSGAERDVEVKLMLNRAGSAALEMDKVKVTIVDAFFEINVTTFIGFDAFYDPIGELTGGDNRSFNRLELEAFRTRQLAIVTPFEEFDMDGVLAERKRVGMSRHYDPDSSLLDPSEDDPTLMRLKDAARNELEIEANRNAPYKTDWARGNGSTLHVGAGRSILGTPLPRHVLAVQFDGNENNPLFALSPGISYVFRFVIDGSDVLNPLGRLTGQHDGFPWYELYIDNVTMYPYDPLVHGEDVYDLGGWDYGEKQVPLIEKSLKD